MSEHVPHAIVIDWYEHNIPDFIEGELIRLYGTMYSSIAWLRVNGTPQDVNTYVAKQGSEVLAVLLCRIDGTCLKVVTEGIELSAEETQRFIDFVFMRFNEVSVVILNAVSLDPRLIKRPRQQFCFSEDIIVRLPDSEEAYVSMLGSATRKNVKRHINRLKRDFPSFEFKAMLASEVGDDVLHEIIRFNHARMSVKDMVSAIDGEEARTIIGMARECGHVFTMKIDGKLCGGAIVYRFGTHFVSRISAHDPAYDDYRLGMTCCFLTVCEAIGLGGKHFHFLWGQYDYKTALLGVQRDHNRVVIYRSPSAIMQHASLAWHMAYHAARLTGKRWLLMTSRRDTRLSHLLRQAIEHFKKIKWFVKFRRLKARLEADPVGPLAEP